MGKLTDNKLQFIEQSEAFITKYPNFNIIHEDKPYLMGDIYLNNEIGEIIEEYKIKIEYTEEFPNRFPHVFELSNKIPKNVDWHIFESVGNCCLSSFPEELIYCNQNYNLITFFEDKIVPYFYAQVFRNKNGFFLKERPHGEMGWISFFFDELKTNNFKIIENSILFILQNKKLDRTAKCYCGSKEKFRKCHRDKLSNIEKLNSEQLIYFLNKISKYS
ncbi:MAG: hypothetical protein V4666_02705 [Bacteroidota bacterium]